MSDQITPTEILERHEAQMVEKETRTQVVALTQSARHNSYKEKIAKKVEKRIGEQFETLVDNAMQLAQGITVAEVQEDGGVKAWTEKPNLNAIIYLLDRLMGKPTQRQEIKDDKSGITVIEKMIKQLANGEIHAKQTITTIRPGQSLDLSAGEDAV